MSPETDNKSLIERLKSNDCNRVPLVREVLADLDTPLSVYLKLADAPYSYLLESVHGGEKWGRYSIIGLATAADSDSRSSSSGRCGGN